MKRLVLSILAIAAAFDIAGDPHSGVLLNDMLDASAVRPAFSLLLASPVLRKIEYWSACLLGMSLVSLIIANLRPHGGPDIIGR